MNVNIEEQINTEFINQIEELPEEYKDPLENTIEYIKKRARCNDYEAAQIQSLMSEQSAQKQGYNYYCRYIAGQSTPEEDNADYYKSIRKSWNKFLDKFANMTLEERAEAFTIVSASGEKAMEVLENAGDGEFSYIDVKTKPLLDKMEALGEELNSKSTTYLVTHLSWTKKKAKELEETSEQYFKRVITSSNEYKILESQKDSLTQEKNSEELSEDEDSANIESDAYKIATNAVDVLNTVGKKVTMQKVWQTANREPHVFGVHDLIQYRIPPSQANAHIYKFLKIEEVKPKPSEGQMESLKCLQLHVIPRDKDGNVIELTDSDIEPKEFDYTLVDRLDLLDSSVRVNLTLEDLKEPTKTSRFKWHIINLDKDRKDVTKGDLFRVYNIDPTRLEERLDGIPPLVEENLLNGGINDIIGGIALIVAGIALILIGIGVMIASEVAGKFAGAGVIVSGIGLILNGITRMITGSFTVDTYRKDNNKHKKLTKELLRDIWKHNYQKIPNKG